MFTIDLRELLTTQNIG